MSKLFVIIATVLVVIVLTVDYSKYVSDNQTKLAIEQEKVKQEQERTKQFINAYLAGKYSE